MRKIAVAMAKCGVGKTTTAVNLAHGLACRGQRVLLVDCDTQGQTAKFLGQKPEFGLYEFITERRQNGQAIARNETLHQSRNNLWLLDGGIRLVELKNWLGEQPGEIRQTVLALPPLATRERDGEVVFRATGQVTVGDREKTVEGGERISVTAAAEARNPATGALQPTTVHLKLTLDPAGKITEWRPDGLDELNSRELQDLLGDWD